MLWRRLLKIVLVLIFCWRVPCVQSDDKKPVVNLDYIALGEMAARYCEVYKCSVDLPPSAMGYPIIAPYYNSESKVYLEAQLRAFAAEQNYSCNITAQKISCVEKK
jgi:hypothetical protein